MWRRSLANPARATTVRVTTVRVTTVRVALSATAALSVAAAGCSTTTTPQRAADHDTMLVTDWMPADRCDDTCPKVDRLVGVATFREASRGTITDVHEMTFAITEDTTFWGCGPNDDREELRRNDALTALRWNASRPDTGEHYAIWTTDPTSATAPSCTDKISVVADLAGGTCG